MRIALVLYCRLLFYPITYNCQLFLNVGNGSNCSKQKKIIANFFSLSDTIDIRRKVITKLGSNGPLKNVYLLFSLYALCVGAYMPQMQINKRQLFLCL